MDMNKDIPGHYGGGVLGRKPGFGQSGFAVVMRENMDSLEWNPVGKGDADHVWNPGIDFLDKPKPWSMPMMPEEHRVRRSSAPPSSPKPVPGMAGQPGDAPHRNWAQTSFLARQSGYKGEPVTEEDAQYGCATCRHTKPWSKSTAKIDNLAEKNRIAAGNSTPAQKRGFDEYEAEMKARTDKLHEKKPYTAPSVGTRSTERPKWHAIHLAIATAEKPVTQETAGRSFQRTIEDRCMAMSRSLSTNEAEMQPFLGAVRARPGCRVEPFPTRKGLVRGRGDVKKGYVPDRRTGK